MENQSNKSSAGKGLGIAGLVIGIVAIILSFVPCVGMWAIVPGIVGIILSAISMKQAGAGGSKGMAIGGLITSVVAVLIACYWIYVVNFMVHEGAEQLMNELEKTGALDSLNNALKELKEVADSTQSH